MANLRVSKRQRQRLIGGSLAVLIAIVIAVVSAGGGDGDGGEASGPPGERPPSAEFELFDGGTATFADFAGKPLVINFWASWCPACVGELPDFQATHEALGDEVTFIGMANADSRGAATGLANDVGLTYTLADDPQGELFRSLGLFAMPSTIFVTADGEIQDVFGGQLTASSLRDRIQILIDAG